MAKGRKKQDAKAILVPLGADGATHFLPADLDTGPPVSFGEPIRPIKCSGYDEYCPVDFTKDKQVQPKLTSEGKNFAEICLKCFGRGRFRDGTKCVNCDNGTMRFVTREFHHFQNQPCKCPPGPHIMAITADCDEVGHGGGRGSGKSEDSFFIIMRGSGKLTSYLNHPNYRFLVLRKNATDLRDYFKRACEFFRRIDPGINVTQQPMEIRFTSGATGVFDHLDSPEAYEKYQGQQFQTVIVEEATQIPSEDLYLNSVHASCRSKYPELIPRIYLTANPGGPGNGWWLKRFIRITANGKRIQPGTICKDPVTGMTRVFVHSTVHDNPYFMRGTARYARALQGLSDVQVRLWYEGDFEAFAGAYFTDFRPQGPRSNEPPHANHAVSIIDAPLDPWWPRLMAMDVGFRHHAAVLKACARPENRIHYYDEMVQSGLTMNQWGVRIAQWCIPELAQAKGNSIPLFISPDAFGNERGAERSLAEQLRAGIESVIGHNSTIVLAPEALGGEKDFFRRQDFHKRAKIVLIRANNQRVFGWNFIRDMMLWRSTVPVDRDLFNPEYAAALLNKHGISRYEEYLRQFRNTEAETLPKMWIDPGRCRLLMEAIPTAQYCKAESPTPEDVQKTVTVHDDVLDTARYLAMGYRHVIHKEPQDVFAVKRLHETMAWNPNLSGADQQNVLDAAWDEWGGDKEAKGFSLSAVHGPQVYGVVN